MQGKTYLSIAVQSTLAAMMLASPALAGINLQCRMTEFCVNDSDCQTMEMAVAFSSDESGAPNTKGEGKILLSGEDELSARFRVDANGVLTATVIPTPDDGEAVMRLITQGDGLGVLSINMSSANLSTIQFGVCFAK